MNILNKMKEAKIITVLAVFFSLITLAFTFEPLVSAVLLTKNLPADTKTYLVTDPTKSKHDFFTGIMNTIPPSHGWVNNVELLNKVRDLVFELKISSATIQNNSTVIVVKEDSASIVSSIRRFLSKLTPFEIKTILPDSTSMIETVIDPGLIEVITENSQNNESWRFTQTNPQLVIEKNGSSSNILINYPQVVNVQGFETLVSCSTLESGLKVVTLNPTRKSLFHATTSSFLAYLKHYSCFQSFSTVKL